MAMLLPVLCSAALPLPAQTSQPASPAPTPVAPTAVVKQSWPDFVSALADAMVEPAKGEDTLSRLLPDDVLIRRFDRSDYDQRAAIREAVVGMTVVATHGYLGVPNCVATDLANDFRDSTRVSDELKNQLIPADETLEKRANITAGQWLTGTLEPQTAQPIGLIVLLPAEEDAAATVPDGSTARPGLLFVLLKAHPLSSGQFRVTHIVFGDMSQIGR
jgi:hypothetical protein